MLQTDDGESCDCMLNQVNIGSGQNNNKFYKLQLVETAPGQVFQFVRYGRVGEGGATQQKGPWDAGSNSPNLNSASLLDSSRTRSTHSLTHSLAPSTRSLV